MSGAPRSVARLAERVWFGGDAVASAARAALRPLAALYGVGVAMRGALYDGGVLSAHDTTLPALSVGNLTVGGTGKTPVSAWLAGELRARGARPAVVLRGYGGDEPLVHAALNPDVPVVANADRVAGIEGARERGADVVVLDDAFQHRRARRVADVVLLSADRWEEGGHRLLPAGPWRERLSALRRASLVIVTRKAASRVRADRVVGDVRIAAPGVPTAVVHLAPAELRPARATTADDAAAHDASPHDEPPLPFARVSHASVFAISAIGDAGAFHAQLRSGGATLSPAPADYPDHYAFDARDVARLAALGEGADLVVCTLKDAVKLAPMWPRAGPPLWYVSQRAALEEGADAVDSVLRTVLAARAPRGRADLTDTAGSGRLTATDHGHRPPPADR